jgi:peptidoglycan/LPS O-acetylase OafA/YrhL
VTGRLQAAQQSLQPRPGYLPALDGLRWLMVFSVACFHYWQHSWWTPEIALGSRAISLDPWLRTGYIWVDGMLLLSGFLLFLPHALSRVEGGEQPGFAGFYRRRFARIVPTYLLNLLVVLLVVAIPEKHYATFWQGARDVLAHLTFTHPFFKFSNLFTPLNGVLWTLGVEVQFYLIFPLVARAFWKKPLLTYAGALAIGFGYRAYALNQPDTAMLVNQLPAFMDVYLNGFMAALAYAWLRKNLMGNRQIRLLITLATLLCLALIGRLLLNQGYEDGITGLRAGQMIRRFPLSVLLSLVFLGVSLGLETVRKFLGNRVFRFLAGISFQFYMWHQVVAIQMRRWGIPQSSYSSPHMAGDRAWQVPFVLLAFGISLLISIVVTFGAERPLARKINLKKQQGEQ